ncbi:MAG: metalloregulator ArsR/SmtB family transcription factor [Chloroflexota bacterium]
MTNLAPDSTLDLVFGALADKTRRAILERLTRGSATVTELADPFDMSLPAISKHLSTLEKAGLITRAKEGRIHHLSLAPSRLHEISAWLDHYRQFWEQNLDLLGAFLDTPSDENSIEATDDQPTT